MVSVESVHRIGGIMALFRKKKEDVPESPESSAPVISEPSVADAKPESLTQADVQRLAEEASHIISMFESVRKTRRRGFYLLPGWLGLRAI